MNMQQDKKQLYVELQTIADQGIVLFLDGSPSTPEYVTHVLCAAEDACYMRDYVYDETEGSSLRQAFGIWSLTMWTFTSSTA